jgi:hypothetical protein
MLPFLNPLVKFHVPYAGSVIRKCSFGFLLLGDRKFPLRIGPVSFGRLVGRATPYGSMLHGLNLNSTFLKQAFRVPENLLKVLNLIIHDGDAFFGQDFSHGTFGAKMMFSAKKAISVDHTVGRDRREYLMGCVHRIAYGSCASAASQEFGDGAVAGDSPRGNQPNYIVNGGKKILVHRA